MDQINDGITKHLKGKNTNPVQEKMSVTSVLFFFSLNNFKYFLIEGYKNTGLEGEGQLELVTTQS